MQLTNRSQLPVLRRRTDVVGDVLGAFESETVAVFMRTAPVSENIVVYVLVSMMALAIALMAIVKLDRVVNSAGRIVTSAGSLYVSPFDTGIVRRINVKVGEVVKKGQALATLDPTFTQADLLQLQQHLGSHISRFRECYGRSVKPSFVPILQISTARSTALKRKCCRPRRM
jgi:multidrug resistance efflux pump